MPAVLQNTLSKPAAPVSAFHENQRTTRTGRESNSAFTLRSYLLNIQRISAEIVL